MNSNNLRALLALYAFFLMTSVIQSCCTETYRIGAKNYISIYDLQDNSELRSDTVRRPFILNAMFEAEWVSAYRDNGLSNQAYATSCKNVFLNTLDKESFSLTLNKSFVFQTDTILAGTNILDFEQILTKFDVQYGLVYITFPETFLNQSDFDEAQYNFKISGQTSDGLDLESNIELFLKL